MKQIEIADTPIGEGHPCFIIGEAGVNHNGDLDLARDLVDAASDSGVDAVKFQTYNSDQLVAPDAAKADYQVDTTYNLGGDSERTNISVVRSILSMLGRTESLVRYVEDRPGHDLRYAIDYSRATSDLDWVPETRFEDGLGETVTWYVEHDEWWRAAKDGKFRVYYERQYAAKLRSSN